MIIITEENMRKCLEPFKFHLTGEEKNKEEFLDIVMEIIHLRSEKIHE